MTRKPIVIIEAPLSGQVSKNRAYLEDAILDSISRGEAPYASHFYADVLNDLDPAERRLGMETGWEFYRYADRAVVYLDLGLSDGMRAGINAAVEHGVPVEYRRLGGWE